LVIYERVALILINNLANKVSESTKLIDEIEEKLTAEQPHNKMTAYLAIIVRIQRLTLTDYLCPQLSM
jgi:hypothetical protein